MQVLYEWATEVMAVHDATLAAPPASAPALQPAPLQLPQTLFLLQVSARAHTLPAHLPPPWPLSTRPHASFAVCGHSLLLTLETSAAPPQVPGIHLQCVHMVRWLLVVKPSFAQPGLLASGLPRWGGGPSLSGTSASGSNAAAGALSPFNTHIAGGGAASFALPHSAPPTSAGGVATAGPSALLGFGGAMESGLGFGSTAAPSSAGPSVQNVWAASSLFAAGGGGGGGKPAPSGGSLSAVAGPLRSSATGMAAAGRVR